jgi:glycosyltransferase involved in cell wall biosynthesis
VKLSIVVPCFNEADNIAPLVRELDAVLAEHNLDAEIIFVDDGSTDNTASLLRSQALADPRYLAVLFRRNYGQTAAMAAGFAHARGEVVIPLDADLQNDPADIPRLLAALAEGYDVVSGWRQQRQDKMWSRRFPSVIANRLIAWVGGVAIHDYGCTLKAYRADVLRSVRLYGEMHRFIPILASWAGARVGEIVVNHRPRTAGVSKYGLSRTFKVVLDLLTVKLLGSYHTKPMYFFGGYGLLLIVIAALCALAVVVIKATGTSWQHTFSLGLLGAFVGLAGMQSVLFGLLAELQVRTYHESQDKPTYNIREIVGGDRP